MFFVYETATGRLHSSGRGPVAPSAVLEARGLTVKEIADADVPARWQWNAETLEPDDLGPAPTVQTDRELLEEISGKLDTLLTRGAR